MKENRDNLPTYRNKFEAKVGEHLGDEYEYETLKLKYVVPAKPATYTPDFINYETKTIIEAKGYFRAADRVKMKLVRDQHPDWTIILMFYNPNAKIGKGSNTTNAKWAEKNGFKWEELPKRKSAKKEV